MLRDMIRRTICGMNEAQLGMHLGFEPEVPLVELDIEEGAEELDEFSAMAGGAVAGYTLPLGMSNKSPKSLKRKKKEGT